MGWLYPTCFCIFSITRRLTQRNREVKIMKGYTTEHGYMGFVNGDYRLFASEADYREWMED